MLEDDSVDFIDIERDENGNITGAMVPTPKMEEVEEVEEEDSEEMKMAHEQQMAREKMAFDAGENEKDRKADLAKTILAKKPEEKEAPDTAIADAMLKAAEAMAAPKLITRDDKGDIVGFE